MRLVLAEPRLMRESISIISDLVNEVTFKVNEDKVEVIAIDPANVAMIDFKLLSSAFVEYEIKEPLEFSVGLDNLKAVLRRAKPVDTISLVLDKGSNRLKLNLKGETNRTFNLALLNPEEGTEQKVPNLKFAAKITLLSSKFDEAIEDMGIVAESVGLHLENDRFIIQSESAFSDAKVEMPSGDETIIIMDGKEAITAKYSIEYLKKISKASRLADIVSLEFGKDYPLKAEYKLLDK
ncbi:hypothetical protein HZB88_02400, partial [archaeon]|nr:hypothetical protein [archaeon]